MAMAQTIPDGVGARYFRAAGGFLRRRREVLPWYSTVQRLLGWLALVPLTLVWIRTTLVALQVRSLVVAYSATHGNAVAQFEGREPRVPALDQLKLSLEAIKAGPGRNLALELFPVSLLVLFGVWLACSRWALQGRPALWRRVAGAATAVVALQAVLLSSVLQTYATITN